MTGYVFFQMQEGIRQDLINKHCFYVEQAQNRLLSQFADISGETDSFLDSWLENNSQHYSSEYGDPGDLYETAHEEAIEFHGLLSDMHQATRLSIIAGMFHEWEKQLRDWLAREIGHWHRGEEVKSRVWRAKFDEVFDLLEHLGWELKKEEFYSSLDVCRLVVNVHKHGEGGSFERLKTDYPEFFATLWPGDHDEEEPFRFLDFSQLEVSDDHLDEFSGAIVKFWQGVPEEITASQNPQVPDWFEKARNKDLENDLSKKAS